MVPPVADRLPADLAPIVAEVCTPRERQVVELLETGLGYRRVASLLGLHPTTVRDAEARAVQKVDRARDGA